MSFNHQLTFRFNLESGYATSFKMKKALGIAVIILIGGLVLNNLLGGFQKVEVDLIDATNYYVYGKEFAGRYNSDKLQGLIDETRTRLSENLLEGELVIINYQDERSEKRGDLKQFIGVLSTSENTKNEQSGLLLRKIELSQVIEARIEVVKLVMPSPEK